jgi:hypothetical protein
MGPEIGVPKAVERGQRGPDQPLLAAEEARSRGLGLFSKQFRKEISRKFAWARSLPTTIERDPPGSESFHSSGIHQRRKKSHNGDDQNAFFL